MIDGGHIINAFELTCCKNKHAIIVFQSHTTSARIAHQYVSTFLSNSLTASV
ncbi:hypothetical protein IKI14_06565 [bacterium]|nr:hypothetical protein [bacterium]